MIRFNCTECDKLLKAGDEYAGRKCKCSCCGQVFSVPVDSDIITPTTVPPKRNDIVVSFNDSRKQWAAAIERISEKIWLATFACLLMLGLLFGIIVREYGGGTASVSTGVSVMYWASAACGGVGAVGLLVMFSSAQRKKLDQICSSKSSGLDLARLEYETALQQLKQSPTCPDLRARVLEFGRQYCRHSRLGGVETIFDEMALKNDIEAACAGAVSVHQIPTTSETTEDRLAKLQTLLNKGLVSKDEYHERRTRILDSI